MSRKRKKGENYQSDEPCVPCKKWGQGMTCWHHMKTRGSGGSDEDYNLISVCLECHNEFHNQGTSHMAKKYYRVMQWLEKNGWYFCDLSEKWKNALGEKNELKTEREKEETLNYSADPEKSKLNA